MTVGRPLGETVVDGYPQLVVTDFGQLRELGYLRRLHGITVDSIVCAALDATHPTTKAP